MRRTESVAKGRAKDKKQSGPQLHATETRSTPRSLSAKELFLGMRRTIIAAQALRRNEMDQKSTQEGVRNSESGKMPSPNRRNAHNVRGFLSASRCVAYNNHKYFLRRKQRNKQRTGRSNEKIESENDKSASRFPPQDRIGTSSLHRNCIP